MSWSLMGVKGSKGYQLFDQLVYAVELMSTIDNDSLEC